MHIDPDKAKFDERGLIPAIVQDAKTRQVLTLAYMNSESLRLTLSSGETWFWSRSRQQLWHKGETSGNTQRVVDVTLDCDSDAVLILVEPAGPACHTGEVSCFCNARLADESTDTLLDRLYEVIQTREQERPDGSYTTYLFNQGLDKILKKIGEESAETIIAAKNDEPGQLIYEVADLLYHLLVLLVARNIGLDSIRAELSARRTKNTGVNDVAG